ncbi:beta-propeller domain-containing protein [Methanotorris formicicus]|uniref:Beta propeller domain protein n=1 Tax=Methanotorris formicicus Mc-S-70 TaxID=647171 RepID=H1KWN1_9EURY|nr:beta-propeller domain-containing protein [Methanotorris formicicus]EHP89146.1 Beta propeller domain protein [Methanotorris formicicus Mc-S-70]
MKNLITFGISILLILSLICGCFEKDKEEIKEKNWDFKLTPAESKLKFEEFKNNLEGDGYYVGGLRYTGEQAVAVSDAKSTGVKESERYSETNVQVKDVDEADILKTNGKIIVFSHRKSYLINPLPPEEAGVINNISQSGNLYLINNTLIIIGRHKIISYDVSNPKYPKIIWQMNLNGSYIDSRLYNNTIYLVVRKNSVECPIIWNGYRIGYDKYYIPIPPPIYIRNFDITYIIGKINIEDGKVESSIAITSSYRTTLYMSKNNLYFAYHLKTNEEKLMLEFLKENAGKYFPEDVVDKIKRVIENKDFGERAKFIEITETINKYLNSLPSEDRHNLMKNLQNDFENYLEEHWEEYELTGIVKVNLDNFEVKSGKVSGHLLNNFAMDEYKGYLRVATTIGDWRFKDRMTNNIFVLDENLNVVGKLTGLEKGERIYAVRFMGDKAYVVTYKETDPLLVIDLRYPKDPKVLGKLKIPGYSTYLHPIGNNLFIGIGRDDDGKLKISLFDISDLENPKEIDKYKLDEYWSPTLRDYHAFLWDEKYKIFFFPVNKHAYIFKVENNEIMMVKDDVHKTIVLRSLFINNYLYTFSPLEMHILDENTWKLIKNIEFDSIYFRK